MRTIGAEPERVMLATEEATRPPLITLDTVEQNPDQITEEIVENDEPFIAKEREVKLELPSLNTPDDNEESPIDNKLMERMEAMRKARNKNKE